MCGTNGGRAPPPLPEPAGRTMRRVTPSRCLWTRGGDDASLQGHPLSALSRPLGAWTWGRLCMRFGGGEQGNSSHLSLFCCELANNPKIVFFFFFLSAECIFASEPWGLRGKKHSAESGGQAALPCSPRTPVWGGTARGARGGSRRPRATGRGDAEPTLAVRECEDGLWRASRLEDGARSRTPTGSVPAPDSKGRGPSAAEPLKGGDRQRPAGAAPPPPRGHAPGRGHPTRRHGSPSQTRPRALCPRTAPSALSCGAGERGWLAPSEATPPGPAPTPAGLCGRRWSTGTPPTARRPRSSRVTAACAVRRGQSSGCRP